MEEPPPYSEFGEQPKAVQVHKQEVFHNREFEDYTHQHDIIISIADSNTSESTTLLHYWDPQDEKSSFSITQKLKPDSLPFIRGFQDLGVYRLPHNLPEGQGIHNYLTSVLERSSRQILGISPRIETMLQDSLHTRSSSSQSGVDLRLFSIPVYSNDDILKLTSDDILVWKWAKPESVYGQKSGFWEIDIQTAIIDGEWNAGKGLNLFVHPVAEQRKEEFAHHRYIHLGPEQWAERESREANEYT